MNRAGHSAFEGYQRRREADRRVIVHNLPITVFVVVLTPVVVYLGVHVLVSLTNDTIRHLVAVQASTSGRPAASVRSVIPKQESDLIAAVLAVAATASIAPKFWGRRQATEAWRQGAEGERLLAQRLARLETSEFRFLHDRRVPRSRANIDHLVIGPTGIFVVDAKNYTGGRLQLSKGTLWHGTHPLTKKLSTTRWEARRVAEAIAGPLAAVGPHLTVTPMMCILGAQLPHPVTELDGVVVISGGKRLLHEIRNRPTILPPDSIRSLAESAHIALAEVSGGPVPRKR